MIKVKKLNENAVIPKRAHDTDAGFDLTYCGTVPILIKKGQTVKVPTGLSFTPPHGYFGAIFARSGLATKSGLAPSNCVGVCDESYTGEYIVPIYNHSDKDYLMLPQERIAQLVFLPCLLEDLVEVEELDKTERGSSGFGDSGKF